MAEHSFPWASVDGDRVYSAENFASHFAAVLTNGVFPVGDQLQVTAGEGMTVSVSAGRAWINGYSYVNTAAHTLSIDAADGVLNRIDRIVLRWSRIDRAIYLAVLKGAPASTPIAPSVVRDADYHDLSLATVTVPAGITAIVGGHISDTRLDTNVCGIASSLITPDTDGWYTQWETEFNTWMTAEQDDLESWLNTIQGLVDGETASQLAGAIADLQNDKADTNHASRHAAGAEDAISMNFQITFPADEWEGDGPYTQTASQEGVTDDMEPIVDILRTGDAEDRIAQTEAYAFISEIVTGDGTVTLVCDETQPTVDLTLRFKVVF